MNKPIDNQPQTAQAPSKPEPREPSFVALRGRARALRGELARREPEGDEDGVREAAARELGSLYRRLGELDADVAEINALYEYWFGPLGREWDPASRLRLDRWFGGAAETDAEIRARFGESLERAAAGAFAAWAETPRGAVALLLLLDQLPRNAYRGTARMFATDARALPIARGALKQEHQLSAPARAVVALCLVHAEDAEAAREGVRCFERLILSPLSRGNRRRYKRMLASARKHVRALERFARYPHRNALLGRESTPAELEFLRARSDRYIRSVEPQPGAGQRLKILVLHSFRQSGKRLSAKTGRLQQELRALADLVFIDAPHAYRPTGRTAAQFAEDFGDAPPPLEHQRCWWISNEDHSEYHGWEESLAYLEDVFRRLGPFDGVLGFSQGAALTGLLAALQPRGPISMQFVICASGFLSRARPHRALLQPGSIELPSLHIFGETDALVDNARTLALAGCFVAPAVASHPRGHFFPDAWPLDVVAAFLRRFTPRAVADPPAGDDAPARESAAPTLDVTELAEADFAGLRAWVVAQKSASEASLLATAIACYRPHRYGRVNSILAPQPGDLAHRLLLATQLERPTDREGLDRRLGALERGCGWSALTRLAVLAHELLEETDNELIQTAIAARFAARLGRERELDVRGSRCAKHAPRVDSATDRHCRLARRIALALAPTAEKTVAYAGYRRLIVGLSRTEPAPRERQPKNASAAALRGHASAPWTREALEAPISKAVLQPLHEPVVPCTRESLDPLLEHLDAQRPSLQPKQFTRGTLMPDGRLDLCKQVVGPTGIGPLLDAMDGNPHVRRLLLGNNIIGNAGAGKIADFIREGRSRVNVWYIAGNRIDARGLAPICDALIDRRDVEGLWLKRNPLGPAGAREVARVLRSDAGLLTVDLVNTGLLDEGAGVIIDALQDNRWLRNLYLGTNGITPRGAAAIADYLAGEGGVDSLFISCNRLGDEGARLIADALRRNRRLVRLSLASNRVGPEGAVALAEALAEHPTLQFLDLGWTRATAAVGELGNRIGNRGCEALAAMLRSNRSLRVLDISHNAVSQWAIDQISEALVDNDTLVALRCPQWGKAVNHDSQDRLAARLEANRRAQGVDPEAIRTPLATREILSVYRTAVQVEGR